MLLCLGMIRSWVVIALACGVAAADPKPEPQDQRVLRLLNSYRATVGLPAAKLDAKLSAGCMEHASYMLQNRGTDAMEGLNPHTQRPNLPGATPAGAACGKAADLFPEVSDLGVAVAGWMAGFYHRRPMLDPGLVRIGVGYAKLPEGSYMAALMFVNDDDATNSAWPIRYPADHQSDVPLESANEIPNPVPGGGTGGYPITLQFPAFDKVTAVTAKLTDANGKAVAFHLSDPDHPATSFGQYGVVSLIPKLPLPPQAAFTVTISATWNTKPGTWSWTFTTLALRAVDATDETAVLAAIDVPSLVRGIVRYGGMMDSANAFLQIGASENKKFKMVSVIIPLALWKQLGKGAAPATLTGKTVEVSATPQLVANEYVNLKIIAPSQLRVVSLK